MRFAFLGFAAIAALTLAGCTPEPAEPEPAGPEPAGPEPAEPEPAAPERAESMQPQKQAQKQAHSSSGPIPAAFHGIWDSAAGDCSAQSETRVEITADAIRFYESVGRATASEMIGSSATVTLTMSGEGQSWEITPTLDLLDDGATLALRGEQTLLRRLCQ